MRAAWGACIGFALVGVAGAQQVTQPVEDARARQAEIEQLREEMKALSARLEALEARERAADAQAPNVAPSPNSVPGAVAGAVPPAGGPPVPVPSPATPPPVVAATQPAPEDAPALAFFRGTTLNFLIDGYYTYNFDHPAGRVNLLRAYDVSSNSFTLNQADVVVEHLPVAEGGKRFGGRIDLMFGQATEALQGSAANELRPQAYRNLYQAYGSYLAPVGSGLEVDFGKFASSLGVEGNYAKDQINYSRSFLFDYLPYYHMGFRVGYNFSPKVNLTYWLVNGAQQTEDFNGFKSQGFIWTLKPAKTLTWNVNYYFGEEQRDVVAVLNPGIPTDPTQPGLPTKNIYPTPNGREHIFDTYATWNVTPKLTLVGEADYVVNRYYSTSQPEHTAGGELIVRYQLPRNYALADRTEYLDDRSGLFSGASQALKEFTFTFEHQFEPGFLARFEYRRDFSNQNFFRTATAGVLTGAQPTATVGLVYWWGMKQGSW